MIIIKYNPSVFYFVFGNATKLSGLLLSIAVCLPPSVYAEGETIEPAEARKFDVKKTEDDIDDVVPVEAGAGGILRKEKTFRTEAESLFAWHTHLLWESRYLTEGRDNLNGDSLISASSEFILDDLNVIPWIAYSPAADYSELNLNFIYGLSLTEALVVYAGYTYLHARYQKEKASDNEVSLAIDYLLAKRWSAGAVIYYSFDADGSFTEFAVNYGRKLNNNFHLDANAVLGVNAEYIPDGHNGLNHYQLRINIAYQAYTHMDVYAYTSYTQAIDRDPSRYEGDELLGEFLSGGVGFSYRF